MKIYKIQFKRMKLKNKHKMILKILFSKSSHLYFNQISNLRKTFKIKNFNKAIINLFKLMKIE